MVRLEDREVMISVLDLEAEVHGECESEERTRGLRFDERAKRCPCQPVRFREKTFGHLIIPTSVTALDRHRRVFCALWITNEGRRRPLDPRMVDLEGPGEGSGRRETKENRDGQQQFKVMYPTLYTTNYSLVTMTVSCIVTVSDRDHE